MANAFRTLARRIAAAVAADAKLAAVAARAARANGECALTPDGAATAVVHAAGAKRAVPRRARKRK